MYIRKLPNQISTPFGEVSVMAWENEEFILGLFSFQGYVRLSIWRQPGTDVGKVISWETLQTLKSLAGFGNNDAVEVYPRNQDIVNTANARHIYIMNDLLPFAMRFKPVVLPLNNTGGKGE